MADTGITSRFAASAPPIPHRASSIEATRPIPPKKRLSLTAIPILSKLGLGKTSSAPTVPTSATAPPPATPPVVSLKQPAQSVVQADATDIGDDGKTEVDEEEHLVMEEPESFDFGPDPNHRRDAPDGNAKSKLTLDIPTYGASTRVPQPGRGYLHCVTERDHDEKEVLKELETNSGPVSRAHTPKSASTGRGVWLCSKPQSSGPSSPVDENGKRRRSVGRPLVVRAMSTGRLASEFDEEGRVICLSNHCGRVLRGRATIPALPSQLEEGENLKRSISAANTTTPPRMGIPRSQTAQNVAMPIPNRRRSVEAGFRRLESFGSWSKRAIEAGDMSM